MRIPLIAVAPCEYDGRRYAIGASFAAYSQDDAKVLVLLGKARLPPLEPLQCSTWNRSTPAVTAVIHSSIPATERLKRVYRRRSVPVTEDPTA